MRTQSLVRMKWEVDLEETGGEGQCDQNTIPKIPQNNKNIFLKIGI